MSRMRTISRDVMWDIKTPIRFQYDKIRPFMSLQNQKAIVIDAKVFGLYGVRNVIAPKGQ